MFNRGFSFDTSKLIPTSKIALKLSCLSACANDIEKADRLYEYMTRDLKDLPDSEPTMPSGIQRFKMGADDIIGWVSEHKDLIQQGIGLIQGLRKPASAAVGVANVPPIPKI